MALEPGGQGCDAKAPEQIGLRSVAFGRPQASFDIFRRPCGIPKAAQVRPRAAQAITRSRAAKSMISSCSIMCSAKLRSPASCNGVTRAPARTTGPFSPLRT